MNSLNAMRTAKIGYICISVILCILGILLIVFPNVSVKLVGICCGILMLVFGCIKLVGYFSKDLFRLAFQYDLATGLLMLALGVIILTNPTGMVTLLSSVFGILILADGLFKIQIAMDSRRFGIHQWWLILSAAIIAGCLGLVLLLRPTESTTVMMVLGGISLLSEGILNLSTVLTAVKIVKNQKPDDVVIEIKRGEF